MSYIKKMRESKKILDAAAEALATNDMVQAHIQELMNYQQKLMDNVTDLLSLHRQLMDNLDVKETEIEREFDVPLHVITTHGTYPVGIECPQHKLVHSNHGAWYICVDGGFIDVTGWHAEKKR